ncbi:MAG: hypothetical protein V1779_16470 [bacterium]
MKKRILICLSSCFLILLGCDDNTSSNSNLYKSEGVITGYDLRECMCCGGWFIVLADSTYRFNEIPKESNINFEKDTFPISVKLDWKKSPAPCLGDEIIVERMKK